LLLSIFLMIGSACSSMIARSKSCEIDSDLAVRKGTNTESELSSLGSCCIRRHAGRSRSLYGSEVKVKEVVLRAIFVNATRRYFTRYPVWEPFSPARRRCLLGLLSNSTFQLTWCLFWV